MINYELTGKVAFVTGAASGIGAACARALAASGASLALADIDHGGADRLAAELRRPGRQASAYQMDVVTPSSVDYVVTQVVAEFGQLNVAINSAGISGGPAVLADCTADDWMRVLDVNLNGVFYCCRAEIRAMRAGGGGAIVNIASVLGTVAHGLSPAYVAAKHAVVGLTKSAALAHAPDRIRVNSVGPGYISTPMIETVIDDGTRSYLEGLHAMGRLGTAEEVASLVTWLASDAASFATGGFYPVDGGYTAS